MTWIFHHSKAKLTETAPNLYSEVQTTDFTLPSDAYDYCYEPQQIIESSSTYWEKKQLMFSSPILVNEERST